MSPQNSKPSLSTEAELAYLREEVRFLRQSLRHWQFSHKVAVENQDHWKFLYKHVEAQLTRLRGEAALRPAAIPPKPARVVQLTFPKPSTQNPKTPCLS